MNILRYKSGSRTALILSEMILVLVVMFLVYGTNKTFSQALSKPFDHQYQVLLPLVYPAVFLAAGYELSTTDVDRIPGLAEFIYGETNSFDIQNIPKNVELVPISSPVAISHYYYLYLVGWVWKMLGVSVESLLVLSFLLRALCAGLLYGLFRLFLGRFGSVTGVLLVCFSSAMLHTGMSLRDFVKTPFLLSVFLILTFLATRPLTGKRLVLLSAALGMVVGVGMGFRQDVLICLPPVLVTLLFLTRIEGTRPHIFRTASILVFAFFFSSAAYPIFKGISAEGNQTVVHSLLLGVSPGMESEMGFGEASYELMPSAFAGDSVNLAAVNVYARRMGNRDSMLNRASAEYTRYAGDKNTHLFIDPYLMFNGKVYARFGAKLVRDLVVSFPADFLTRAWCAMTAIFHMPAEMHEKARDGLKVDLPGWLEGILVVEEMFALHMARWGLCYTGLLLLVLSGRNLALALFFTGMLAWFTGYTSILYEYRHNFYLVFIPVLVLLVCVQAVGMVWAGLRKRQGRRQYFECSRTKEFWKHSLTGLIWYLVVVGCVVIIPVFATRLWQKSHVNDMADRLLSAHIIPVSLEDRTESGFIHVLPGTKLPQLEGSDGLPPGETAWEYVALVFETHGRDIPVTIHYKKDRLLNDFSQSVTVKGIDDAGVGRTTFFFPIYETGASDDPELWRDFLRTYPVFEEKIRDSRPLSEQEWWRRGEFEGISFPEEYQGLFAGMFRVSDLDDVTVLPLIQIPDERRSLRWFKMCRGERFLRECLGWSEKRKEECAPATTDGLCWHMDEDQLFRPGSRILVCPLFGDRSADGYRARWESRIAYYPGIAKTAALDIANAGTSWLQTGDVEASLKAYQAACEWDPENALYSVRLGQLFLQRGEVAEAVQCFKKGLELHPLLPETADKVDALALEQGNPDLIEILWTRVFDLNPESWFAGMRLGGILEKSGKIAQAAEAYGHVHAKYPEHPDTRLALARCLGRTQRHTEAFRLIEETAGSTPDYKRLCVDHLSSLGEFLFGEGRTEAAVEAFSRALGIAPEDPSLLLRKGDILIAEGDTVEAKGAYTKALTLLKEDDHTLRSTLLGRIEALNQETLTEPMSVPSGS